MIFSKRVLQLTIPFLTIITLSSSSFAQPSARTSSHPENVIFDEKANATELILPIDFYTNWISSHVKIGNVSFSSLPENLHINLKENGSEFVFPVKGPLFGGFCYRGRVPHTGIDIGLKKGTPVLSTFDGVVRMAKYYGGYGKIVVVRHLNGIETVYAHLSKIKVKVNQQIKAGDIVGLGGRTGKATANHLHYETRYNGVAFDPIEMLDYSNYALKSDTLILNKESFLPKYKIVRTRKGKKAYDLNYNSNGEIAKPINTIENTPKTASLDTLSTIDKTKVSAIYAVNTAVTNKKNTERNYAKAKYYTVREGDTLGHIAQKNGTSVSKITKLNGFSAKKTLQLGQKIRIR